jgi:uncharacterized phage protein gp47/JayE
MTDISVTSTITDQSVLPFDYTSRDFAALINDITRRMSQEIPGWEATPASLDMALLDQVAYVGDILNFYIDRMAAEAYIQSAVMRESVLNLAYAFGYVPTPQTAALAAVTFTKSLIVTSDMTIPAGTQVYANSGGDQVIFETTADLVILTANQTGTVNVREGLSVTMESIGVSSGAERMQFPLLNRNVIKDSVVLYVRDGGFDAATGQPTLVPWTQVQRMIDTDAVDRAFTIFVDESGLSIIRTGDGVTGRIPTTGAAMYASYRYGKGATGNVAANTIRSMVTGGDIATKIDSLTNAAPAAGGADAESMASMRTNIPRSLRALDRAVTLQDYADLAVQVPGVAKAAAGAVLNTNVSLAILGFNYSIADAALIAATQAFITARKMIGTTVTIIGPTYKLFNVTGTLVVSPLYVRASVLAQVNAAITKYYDFSTVDFGFTSRLSDLFAAVMSVQGVANMAISQHYVQGDTAQLNQNITILYNEFPKVGTLSISASGGIVPT